MKKKILAMLLTIVMLSSVFVQTASADFQPELPSLYKVFKNYFMFGGFQAMNDYISDNVNGQMLRHHYISWSPQNEMKPQYLFSASASAAAYNAAVNAEYESEEERQAAIDKANRTVVLASTTNQETFLQRVKELNSTRPEDEKIKVKMHTLLWHNMTPPEFFRNGFSSSGDYASPEVMLDRIESYIKQVFERFAPYADVIYSWDVVNEAIDDYTGHIRNENDYQPSDWGRIFKRPDLKGDERLYAESVYVRHAFAMARKYAKQYGLDWSFVYNDFFDSDKSYEPKRTSTYKMLGWIYDEFKAEGSENAFVVGFQGRHATALDINVFKETYNLYSQVCDRVQFTEADVRCDLVLNPDYDPDSIYAKYYLDEEEEIPNPDWDRNHITAKVMITEPGWTASWANLPKYQKAQADWMADLFDFLLENSVGNGGKIELYAVDGLHDGSTFNRNTGCTMFMAADGEGNTNYTAKMSYYAVIGSAARFELKKKIDSAPQDIDESKYTEDSINRYYAALQEARDVLNERIYDMDGVNKVYEAGEKLTEALENLTDVSVALSDIQINGESLEGFEPGIYEYDLVIPAGVLPVVTATPMDSSSSCDIQQVVEVPGTAVITVTSSDGSMSNVYKINFNYDTRLQSLKVGNVPVSDFSPDKYTYKVVVERDAAFNVTAEPFDPGVNVKITDATSVPGQAVVEVTAGGATTTYTLYLTYKPYDIDFIVGGSYDIPDIYQYYEHVNPNDNYSFGLEGYTIITEEGDVSDGSIKNMLLQPAGGDWAAKAEVILSEVPSQNNQQAGLILYQDNNNYVKLTYERVSSTNYFSLYNMVNGTNRTVARRSVSGISRPYFMFVKSGTKVEGYYSTDGFNYNLLGSVEVDMTNPKLGPYACNGIGSNASSISATFPHVVIIDDPADAFGTLTEIKVDGKPLKGFSPDVLNYTYVLTRDVTEVPQVEATPLKDDMNVSIENAQTIPGTTRITVSSKGAWRTYEIAFGYGPVSVDFTTGSLDRSIWTILNEDPANYSVEAGKGLRLPTLQGDIYQDGSSWKNVFLQEAFGDWDIVSKVYYPAAPSADYQQQALLVWQDENNYIKLDMEYGSWAGGLYVQMGSEVNGTFSGSYQARLTNISPGTPDFTIYFRIKKTGNSYEGFYSLDGVNYTRLGKIDLELKNPKIGLFATKNSNNATIDTYCQYIEVLSSEPAASLKGPNSVNNEETFTLTYGVKRVNEVKAQEVTIIYDDELFEYIDAEVIDGKSVIQEVYDDEPGIVKFIIVHGEENTISGEADIMDIQFKAKASGTGTIKADSVLETVQGETINAETGRITVTVDADKTRLEEAINNAQNIYSQAVEGLEVGQYPAGTKDRILKAAIDNAKAVLETSATTEQVEEAIKALEDAVAKFTSLVITEDTGNVNNVPGHSIGDIAIIAYYYGTKEGDAAWNEIKYADINGDGEIGLYELAFIAAKIFNK